jgi:hypothetical protein
MTRPQPRHPRPPRRTWAAQLVLSAFLWLIPVGVVWILVTPYYNRFLLTAAQNLCRLTESPDVTNLVPVGRHDASIERRDFPPSKSLIHGFRVTDVHFHLVLLGALFLATPGIPWRERMTNLGWAVLVTVFFDLFLCFFWVKFVYATRLGAWSLAHYGLFARNAYGLTKHLLDLPFKLALPFLLWAGFYYERFLEERARLKPRSAPPGPESRP